MKNKDRYPDNWNEIALRVKIKANWTCAKCQLECIPNGADFRTEIMGRSLRAQLTLTVHHSDYDPSNNHPSNLIPLCSACHLYMHRGRRKNISPGQLKLDLGV
ncbi:HNH endonuclease [Crocosphaera sp. UHCC 0190]|uniref:HNH endonuclease n=1 Tax=Crocosphaera sp. UHCC 0190 TaxID=3110246 RepID=UPI002B201DA6|nr:HNH endonuclease [Crocosphaera sp. UHCC 0190]MEA5511812.1 HNH endonuclease [Crocosphaera sp. UHCC 0190]